MRRALVWAGVAALLGLGVGCASSEDEERHAEVHEYRAQQAAAVGDYDRAAAEQHRANQLRREANEDATTPAPVPPPAPLPPPVE